MSNISISFAILKSGAAYDISKAQVNVVLSLARALGCDVEDIIE